MNQRGVINITAAIAIGSAAAGAAGGAWLAYKLTTLHYVSAIDKAASDRAQAVAEANARATAAGFAYEAWKAAQKPRVVMVTRTVEHEIQAAPQWASTAIPDSLRDALAAAAVDSGAAEPAAAVPAVPAASAADQSGLGLVLRLGPRLGSGLSSAAKSAD